MQTSASLDYHIEQFSVMECLSKNNHLFTYIIKLYKFKTHRLKSFLIKYEVSPENNRPFWFTRQWNVLVTCLLASTMYLMPVLPPWIITSYLSLLRDKPNKKAWEWIFNYIVDNISTNTNYYSPDESALPRKMTNIKLRIHTEGFIVHKLLHNPKGATTVSLSQIDVSGIDISIRKLEAVN